MQDDHCSAKRAISPNSILSPSYNPGNRRKPPQEKQLLFCCKISSGLPCFQPQSQLMIVRNISKSNFQSINVISPHSSHFLPFQSISKHSNQTVQLRSVHLPGTDMQADCFTANRSRSCKSSVVQNVTSLKIILYHIFYRPLCLRSHPTCMWITSSTVS